MGRGNCPALRWSWQPGQLPGTLKKIKKICRSKVIIANQVRAYLSSLELPPYSVTQTQHKTRHRPGGRSNEHVRAFGPPTVTEAGIRIAPLSYKGEHTLIAWRCMALRKVAWAYTRWRKTIRSHADRGCTATKKWYTLFYKVKPPPTEYGLIHPL